jgi:hypothetical protein
MHLKYYLCFVDAEVYFRDYEMKCLGLDMKQNKSRICEYVSQMIVTKVFIMQFHL